MQSASTYPWTLSTSDSRALVVDSVGDRIATTWYSSSSFSFDVDLTDGNPHQLALYALDWDRAGRSEKVTITDAGTGTQLISQTVTNFGNGVYLMWQITGNVVITVQLSPGSSPNAVISGVFFGGAPQAGPASATFVGADTTTQGNWVGKYGSKGAELAPGTIANPTYGTFNIGSTANWTWASSTSDMRALETANGAARIAATWYNPNSFGINVDVTDGNTHQISLYVLDWDELDRNEMIQIENATSLQYLDTRTIPDNSGDATNTNTTSTNFFNGTYLIWNISGHVKIAITTKM